MGFFGAQKTLDPWADFYRLRYLYPRNAASSGTGASGSVDTGGANLNSGTATSGYGRCTISSFVTTPTPASGAGIDYDCAFSFSVFGAFSITDANHLVRIIVGGNSGVPATANNNAISSRGFGLELSFQNSRTEARLFAHDGTTYSTSAYTGSAVASVYGLSSFAIGSDGLGNIYFDSSYIDGNNFTSSQNSPPPFSRLLTLSGGPTGLGGGTLGYIDIAAINSATSAPAAGATVRTQYQMIKYGT
jgi:hypothetical protein